MTYANNHYDIFDDYGSSPATPEEWEHMRTTHDIAWLGTVTAEFTRRVMDDYLHNHKQANLVAKHMDDFSEVMEMQTGLSNDEIGHMAMLASFILEDREFRDDPEGARESARNTYMESLNNDGRDHDELPEDLVDMASEFAEMLNDRRHKKHTEDMQIRSMEYAMASSEVEEALKKLCEAMGLEMHEVMPGDEAEFDNVLDRFFGNDNN